MGGVGTNQKNQRSGPFADSYRSGVEHRGIELRIEMNDGSGHTSEAFQLPTIGNYLTIGKYQLLLLLLTGNKYS
jgi:hypothetical protein